MKDLGIYGYEFGPDYDLVLLVEVLRLLDSQLDRIHDESNDPELGDPSSLYDRVEHIVGLGLVACQTYIHARSGRADLPKTATLDLGPRHACGHPVVRIVNAAANYWKHAPEAGLSSCPADTMNPATLAPLTGVGVTGSEYIVAQALDRLLDGPPARLMGLVPALAAWRDALWPGDEPIGNTVRLART